LTCEIELQASAATDRRDIDYRQEARYSWIFAAETERIISGGQHPGGKLMGILSWLVVGLIAGFIGSKIVNKSGEGLVRDIILGIVGAIVGGAIFQALGRSGVTGVNIYSIFVAVVGAVIILVAYHAIIGSSAST
jgi:uncharacterized membrane protein YeaQ/YmgE (transglycosylase-associated protein family)